MMARAHPTFALRPYLPQDAPLLAEIFRASIEELTEDDYNPAQQEAWASLADDMEEFAARLGKHLTLDRHHGGLAGRLHLARCADRDRPALRASGGGRAGRRHHALRRAGEAFRGARHARI